MEKDQLPTATNQVAAHTEKCRKGTLEHLIRQMFHSIFSHHTLADMFLLLGELPPDLLSCWGEYRQQEQQANSSIREATAEDLP